MEILNEEVKHCEQLLATMETHVSQLNHANEKLNDITVPLEVREQLWAEEFNLTMIISSVFQDIVRKALVISKKNPEMRFIMNKLVKRAKELNRTEYVDVKPSR